MQRLLSLAALAAALFTLAACGPTAEDRSPDLLSAPDLLPAGEASLTARVITNQDDRLLLAKVDGADTDVYTCSVLDVPTAWEGEQSDTIHPGAIVEVQYDGGILEIFPAQIGTPVSIRVTRALDDRCALYLQALAEMTQEDPALDEGISQLALDLSQTALTPNEKQAVAWVFGQQRGMDVTTATWQELADRGVIDQEDLYWEDGVLYSIEETAETDGKLTFTVGKWRSGTGACYYTGCTSQRQNNGHWATYEIGSLAMA